MVATLVTDEEAAMHLNIDLEFDNGHVLEALLGAAEADVLKFIERIDTGWSETTVPPEIKVAILLECAYLWEHRGDDDPTGEPKSPAVRSLLKMWRDPVIA
jgi:hypothetical protein